MTDTAGAGGGPGGAGGLLGGALGRGSIAETLLVWGLLNQLVQAILAPVFAKIEQDVASVATTTPISPPDLVTLVLREWQSEDQAAAQARLAGLSPDDFALLVKGAGEPPGLESVLQWYRRSIIPWAGDPGTASVEEAIRTSRIPTKVWADAIRHSNVVPIPVADAVDAVVEGQIPLGDRTAVLTAAGGGTGGAFTPAATTAYEIAWANGITPDQFDVLVHTRGNPPAPSELLTLFRRGLIAWTGTGPTETTVQQGIYEGATKDKWEPIYKGLVRAVPSVYEIRQMLKAGAVSQSQAAGYLTDLGYTQAAITGVLSAATAEVSTTDKKLTASVITTLYYDQAITATQAKQLLQAIGYGPGAAAFAIEAQDIKRVAAALNSAVSKIGSYFTAHKITATAAKAALAAYNVPASQAAQLVATWTIERTSNVKLLTEAQIADAWYYGIMSYTQAVQELQALGYTPYDAYVVLAVKAKGPIPDIAPPPTTALAGTG